MNKKKELFPYLELFSYSYTLTIIIVFILSGILDIKLKILGVVVTSLSVAVGSASFAISEFVNDNKTILEPSEKKWLSRTSLLACFLILLSIILITYVTIGLPSRFNIAINYIRQFKFFLMYLPIVFLVYALHYYLLLVSYGWFAKLAIKKAKYRK